MKKHVAFLLALIAALALSACQKTPDEAVVA